MTAQRPEIFINNHATVHLGNLELYFVSDGLEQLVDSHLPDALVRPTDLWRGYVATWILNLDGTLTLDNLAYETPQGPCVQKIDHVVEAEEFSLQFQPYFGGPSTQVPFKAGRIVEDRSQWKIDEQSFEVFIERILPMGVVTEDYFFIPKSFFPDEVRENLECLRGRKLLCEVFKVDREHNVVTVKPIKLPDNLTQAKPGLPSDCRDG